MNTYTLTFIETQTNSEITFEFDARDKQELNQLTEMFLSQNTNLSLIP